MIEDLTATMEIRSAIHAVTGKQLGPCTETEAAAAAAPGSFERAIALSPDPTREIIGEMAQKIWQQDLNRIADLVSKPLKGFKRRLPKHERKVAEAEQHLKAVTVRLERILALGEDPKTASTVARLEGEWKEASGKLRNFEVEAARVRCALARLPRYAAELRILADSKQIPGLQVWLNPPEAGEGESRVNVLSA